MAYNSYNKLWESEVDGIVSRRDKLQDRNINQLKLEIHDTYKKHKKQQQISNLQMKPML